MIRPGEQLHIINNSVQNHAYKQMNSRTYRQTQADSNTH